MRTRLLVAALVLSSLTACEGIGLQCSSCCATYNGTDWVVIQFAQDGSVISSWVLDGRSVQNESNSDGILFKDDNGNLVHLSGHYIYIQIDSREDPYQVLERYKQDEGGATTP